MKRPLVSSPAGTIRPPAVAGAFYPAEPNRLRQAVAGHVGTATATVDTLPKAVIAPHAGYVYSGPVAGNAFKAFTPRPPIRRVVVLGPSHYVAFPGLALSSASRFETPLGLVPVDEAATRTLAALPQVRVFDPAHAEEHALEVELPFLQELLGDFTLVPLVVGDATDEEVGAVIDTLWGGPETLFVISSDLSHFLDYDAARELDRQTARAIESREPEAIGRDQACGRIPIRGWLWAARRRGLNAQTLDLRNSGDTAGARERVVGYGAFVFG